MDGQSANPFPKLGEMGARMQALDWSQTPVGAVEFWSQSLKSTVRTLLGSRYPMILLWEQELIQIYNDAYINLIGTKHPYALGRSIRVTQAESWDVIGPMITDVMTTGIPNWVEDQLLAVNRSGYNEEAHFSLSYSAVEDDAGIIRGMLCVCSEVTQQVLGERRLRLQRDLAARAGDTRSVDATCQDILAAIAEYPLDVPFALIYLRSSDDHTLRMCGSVRLEDNQAIAPLTVSLADPTDRWFLATAMAGQSVMLEGLDRDLAISGGPWNERVQRAIALPIPSSNMAAPLGVLICGISPNRALDEGYQSFYELLAGQVSVSLRNAQAYEEERRRAEMLAEIDRAKTVFFSNVSHEFRTPLTLMLNPLDDLLQKSNLSPADREQVAVAYRNSQRLLKLVNTLLDFSRIEAGRVQAVYEPTDLASLTADLASVFRSAVEKAGLQLVVDCPPLPEPVYVDRQLWEKIVLNLLSNAFKFTFEGCIAVSLCAGEDDVKLVVNDTGTGIPAPELPHLFERFHRVAGAQGRSYEGSGIGLSLVQELVKLHGGTVTASSVLTKGSTFVVQLPLGCAHLPSDQIQDVRTQPATASGTAAYVEEALGWAAKATEDPSITALPHRSSARILLADDNADMRHYLQGLLSEQYDVEAVADGQAALEAVRRRLPDLVLTDVMMPKLDGFGLLQQLRADPQTCEMPILLLSARAGEEAAVEGLEAGADDYLIKPFSAKELLARVATNLELGRSRRNASQQRFRFLAESIPQMVWTADAWGRVDYYSPHWLDYTGLTLPQNQGLGWHEIIHPDDRPHSLEMWSEAAQNGTRYDIEHRLRRADGVYHWHLTRALPMLDEQGQVVRWFGTCTDIADRKCVEAKVQTLNQQLTHRVNELQTLFDLLPIGVAIADDPQCRLIRMNPYLSKLLRLPLNTNASHSVPAEQRPSYRLRKDDQDIPVAKMPMQFAAIHNTEVRDEVIDLVHGDGTVIKLLCNASPLLDAQGSVRGGLGVFVDITQRIQHETALRESMAILSTINEATPTLLYVKDRQGRLLMANPATIRLIGKPEVEVIGKTERDFLDSDEAEQIIENDRRVMETGQVEVFEESVAVPEGLRTFLSTKSPYRDEQGTVIGLIGVSTDISDRKQAELEREHLLTRERHYVSQLQGLTTAALAINAALSVEQVLQLITRKAASIIGAHQSVTSMTIDQNWAQAINATYLSEKYAQWRDYDAPPNGSGIYAYVCQLNRPVRMTQTELEAHAQWQAFGKEATHHPPMRGWLAAPLVGRDGQNIGLIQLSDKFEGEFTEADEAILVQLAQMASVAVENARLYEAEQRARTIAESSREEAQAANRIKDEFLAVLSHELRSPLNPILGWAKLLQTGSLDAARTKQALTTIERNAKLQAELIEDLLDVSRILRGKLSLSVGPVNLVPIIQAAIETVRLAAEAKCIQIKTKLSADVELVSGDSTRLQQIVWNLLSNAVKFTSATGQVAVQLETVNNQAQITVSDTGKGIAPEFLPYVFDYFRQEDGATTRQFGGLGLGLAIVRHLVELHGGTIQADSAGEGLGATFTVMLPLIPAQPTISQTPLLLESSLDLRGVQLLVVDDETDTRDFVAFLLEQAGATVVSVASASEAMAALSQCQPDVLLSDIGMPEMDGYMLLRQIRALPPEHGGQVKAIALTAYAGELDQQRALQVGFQRHISKPVEPEGLIRAIIALL